MKQTAINDLICKALLNLSELNRDLYDYWIHELYTVGGDFIESSWNELNLQKMEDDVMHVSQTLK